MVGNRGDAFACRGRASYRIRSDARLQKSTHGATRRMRELFHIAGERLEILLREGNLSGATTVLFQLGREALAETCDWLLLHRERQIEVPTG